VVAPTVRYFYCADPTSGIVNDKGRFHDQHLRAMLCHGLIGTANQIRTLGKFAEPGGNRRSVARPARSSFTRWAYRLNQLLLGSEGRGYGGES
jgi:hypothetical protein